MNVHLRIRIENSVTRLNWRHLLIQSNENLSDWSILKVKASSANSRWKTLQDNIDLPTSRFESEFASLTRLFFDRSLSDASTQLNNLLHRLDSKPNQTLISQVHVRAKSQACQSKSANERVAASEQPSGDSSPERTPASDPT